MVSESFLSQLQSAATSITAENTIPEDEVIMLAADDIYDAEDIPVSYHNAMILNDVRILFKEFSLIPSKRTPLKT